ncbi:MAG: methyltransferase domain-containing protein [Bacteroidia bacterium]
MQTPDSRKDFWDNRYQNEQTGWDLGMPSPPLKAYFDQLKQKDIRILMPGAGNAHEAAYLFQQGFEQVHVLDISPLPLAAFAERFPNFPKEQLIEGDFFKHEGQYDLIVEQTFFCTFHPVAENRALYAQKAASLLKPGGKLVGLWFDFVLTSSGPPFGGSKAEYLPYFEPHFDILSFDRANNSVASRQGSELFGIMRR